MRTAVTPEKAADSPELLHDAGAFGIVDDLISDEFLAEFADDEDATVAERRSPARGALVGMMLGAAFWGTILLAFVRR